jgi:hypothetical protein
MGEGQGGGDLPELFTPSKIDDLVKSQDAKMGPKDLE